MLAKHRPNLLFLCGTSAVGKTETLNLMIENESSVHYSPTCKDDIPNIITVKMETRKVRERLGNPTWDELSTNYILAHLHQRAIYYNFLAKVKEVIETAIPGPSHCYVFDRSPFDVSMYSIAFGLNRNKDSRITEHTLFSDELLSEFGDTANFRFDLFNPDPSIPYVEIEARPPKLMRDVAGLAAYQFFSQLKSQNIETPSLQINTPSYVKAENFKEIDSTLFDLYLEKTENKKTGFKGWVKQPDVSNKDMETALSIAKSLGVTETLLLRSGRAKNDVVKAKRIIAYYLVVERGYSKTATGKWLNIDRTTVEYHISKVEDARDDPVYCRYLKDLFQKIETKK